MKILVAGNDEFWYELTSNNQEIEWLRIHNSEAVSGNENAQAVFIQPDAVRVDDYSKIEKPVFIDSVSKTLREINVGTHVVRINGWKGFLKRNSWEVAGKMMASHHEVINALQKKIIVVPDEPGFISARVIAMIINEAFYAKAENVSTENEIDIAMKLGTNYPYGPFEWANEIGIKNIYDLLLSLSNNNPLYTPCVTLEQKVNNQ